MTSSATIILDESCAEFHDAVAAFAPVQVFRHVLAGVKFDLVKELPEDIKARLMHSRHSMLAEYCKLSSDTTFELVETAGHDIARQAPEAVLSAIRRILRATKKSKP